MGEEREGGEERREKGGRRVGEEREGGEERREKGRGEREEKQCVQRRLIYCPLTSSTGVQFRPSPDIPFGQGPHLNSVSESFSHFISALKQGWPLSLHGSAGARKGE